MSKLTELLTNKINITPEMEAKARQIYDEVSDLLKKTLAAHDPDIFSQGSFMLKTIIRPVKGDEYDLDFVCRLNIAKDKITQADLKKLVGDALKTKYSTTSKQLEPKNRCWRINFPNFHVDVLPAIPETDLSAFSEIAGTKLMDGPIAIPDKELHQWKSSNPRGYAIWFREQEEREETKRRMVVENTKEPLPKQNVGVSVLQNAIKVMKYHRDQNFKDNLENKPISIILTTLAAQYYDGEQDIVSALYGIINRIVIAFPSIFEAGQIPNPALPTENFADKWADKPERKKAFKEWVQSLHTLLQNYVLHKDNEIEIKRLLENSFRTDFGANVNSSGINPQPSTGKGSVGTITNPPRQWYDGV